MKIHCVWEHNGNDSILYAANFVGAYTRGEKKEIALQKMAKSQFPKPPIIIGITMKKIITKAWAVTITL